MDGLEDRVRALAKQVGRYRIITRIVNAVVAIVLLACAANVVSNLLALNAHVRTASASNPLWRGDATLRVKRLEIVDEASTRPVCVLRSDDGGGRIEVFDSRGTPLAGFDGNHGLVVRSRDGPQFPETRPPR